MIVDWTGQHLYLDGDISFLYFDCAGIALSHEQLLSWGAIRGISRPDVICQGDRPFNPAQGYDTNQLPLYVSNVQRRNITKRVPIIITDSNKPGYK